jgi:hypothetical protein
LHDEILAFEHYIRIIVVHETLKFFRTHKWRAGTPHGCIWQNSISCCFPLAKCSGT